MASPLSSKLAWELANPLWAAALNPVIAGQISQASILENIVLVTGVNIINHKLGRTMRGWFFTDINADIDFHRSAPLNSKTLTLTCSGPAIVNIGVF